MDLVFSSLLVCIAVELYICNSTGNLFEVILIFRAMDYTGHGVPPAATTAARGYLSYEYELIPPIRTAGGTTLAAAVTSSYAIRNLSM